MQNLYIKPYGRCAPYLMGFLLGVLFTEYRANQQVYLDSLRKDRRS
jgi:hypothetical protein